MPVLKYERECWKGWSSSLAAFLFCAMDKFEYRTVTRGKLSLQWGLIYFNVITSLTLLVSSAWNKFWLLTNGPRPVTGQAGGSNSKSSLEYRTSICNWEITLEVILCLQCTCLAAAAFMKPFCTLSRDGVFCHLGHPGEGFGISRCCDTSLLPECGQGIWRRLKEASELFSFNEYDFL